MHRRGLLTLRRAVTTVLLLLAVTAAAPPDDPLLERQYHLRTVRAFGAWDEARGAGQVIAVLDTGVDLDHPDLKGRLVAGIDLVDRGTRPRDRNGHGTFVAGVAVALADNAEGGAGVAPRARVMPVRVLDDEGAGTSDVVADGIRWATNNGATVINLSLADVPGQEQTATDLITTDVELAIRQAALEGVVVVAAAGNDGMSSTPYARDLPALVVGATDADDAVWEHSNHDDTTLFAPGVEIVSTYVGDPYAIADGTSFATPIVSAAAALLLQQDLDQEEARERLADTARPVGAGVGRVDVAAALGVAPPDRSTPSPRPSPTGTEGDPRPRKPRAQPEPLDPEPPRERPDSQPARQPAGAARTEVAQVPAATEPPAREQPSPIPEPTAATAPPLAADEPAAPASGPPWVLIAAGGVLFAVVVLFGAVAASRRGR